MPPPAARRRGSKSTAARLFSRANTTAATILMGVRLFWILVVTVIGGCAVNTVRTMDERYGHAAVRDRVETNVPAGAVEYHADVEPILNRRCLVCHACYDAPCQLKMESFAGLDRGATKALVYHSARLVEAPPTRLGIDAQTTAQWRTKGFDPVLNERSQNASTNLNASVLYNMLALKVKNPLPVGKLPDGMFDFSLDRPQSCSTLDEFADYARKHPEGGMPFAMPGIATKEFATISAWLSAGAKVTPDAPLPGAYQDAVADWEAFFNSPSLKAQLMSRYMYEHLFLADIYFDEIGTAEHFRLVRSTTPPGQPIDIIATRRPYGDPGVPRPYYRLQRDVSTLVSKTHMPYALNAARKQRWQSLFLDTDYRVDALPDYTLAHASNPFYTFQALPVTSRYQFMIDEAQYTIMGFIKGPVCRGQVALDVIEDQFWVWFIDPTVEEKTHDAQFLAEQIKDLTLPDAQGSDVVLLTRWLDYAKLEKKYLAAKAAHDLATYPSGRALTVNMIWDGGGVNQNAALTIFRHFNSATVVKGLVGAEPKTAWVIDYPLLERIHYLLVAGYDVYGDAGHQLFSRLYMDFLRIGGEFNFLYFMPKADRTATLEYWYRGAEKTINQFLAEYQTTFDQDTGIEYVGGNSQHQLYQHLRNRIGPALSRDFDLDDALVPDDALRSAIADLAAVHGIAASLLPELSLVSVTAPSRVQTFTLIHNDAHTNVASMGGEAARRLPADDTLTVVPGILGAYPNAFFQVNEQDLPRFVSTVAQLSDDAQYTTLVDAFGVRRSDSNFWAHGDLIFEQVEASKYPERGVLDLSRLENR
jgi:hypothetical protein